MSKPDLRHETCRECGRAIMENHMECKTDSETPSALVVLLAEISAIRVKLDAIEECAQTLSALASRRRLSVSQWVRLQERPKNNTESWTVRVLEKALELRDQGYSCDQVRRMFGWKSNKNFVAFMQRFFNEYPRVLCGDASE